MSTPSHPMHDAMRKQFPRRISVAAVFYMSMHLAVIPAVTGGQVLEGFILAIGFYVVRNLALIIAFHRYFAHRSFQTSRVFQFMLALAGSTAAENGVLWWAQKHRQHHRYSDTPRDIHSPYYQGVVYSHSGWFLAACHRETNLDLIPDFAKFAELRILDRFAPAVHIALAVGLSLIGGLHAFLWGYCVSTVFVWHSTHVIQSVAHLWGRRDYPTTDESRNNWLLGLLTLGEGWHNNHHYYPVSARHGFWWWQIDPAYWVIRLLAIVGLVWKLRIPPPHVLHRKCWEKGSDVQQAWFLPSFLARLNDRRESPDLSDAGRQAIDDYLRWAELQWEQCEQSPIVESGSCLAGTKVEGREAAQRLFEEARHRVYPHLTLGETAKWELEFAEEFKIFRHNRNSTGPS